MKVTYFEGTDTLLVNFSEAAIVETRDLNEDVLVEFDGDGRIVSMTIEHAKEEEGRSRGSNSPRISSTCRTRRQGSEGACPRI